MRRIASSHVVGRTALLLALCMLTAASDPVTEHASPDTGLHGNGVGDAHVTGDTGTDSIDVSGNGTKHDTADDINFEYYENSETAEVATKEFIKQLAAQRKNTSSSIMDFQFRVNRMRVLSKTETVPKSSQGIVYWMYRDQRVEDNWALLYAQKLALENEVPLHIVFCKPNNDPLTTYRHYKFMIEGLKQIETECQYLNIQFHYLLGNAVDLLPSFVRKNKMGAVVVDFTPLREFVYMLKLLSLAIGATVPVIQIDAHNVVPCWKAANRQQRVPAGIRHIMDLKLKDYLTEFPRIIKHPYSSKSKASPTEWKTVFSQIEMDRTVKAAPRIRGGYNGGIRVLTGFIEHRLPRYDIDRNDPLKNGLSNLSPWLRFGHISAQRVLLEVLKFNDSYPESVKRYKEEVLIRRELSDNYCYYNEDYDNFQGGPLWGRLTLNDHRNDRRNHIYAIEDFENSKTHDNVWNSANRQMVKYGKLHRFLRPYWAKKILEYSACPEDGIATANYLNNKYSIDGMDPNGYVGIMWAMTGLHDKPLVSRPVFGKLRYMSYMGCRTKFDATAYITKMLGTHHSN